MLDKETRDVIAALASSTELAREHLDSIRRWAKYGAWRVRDAGAGALDGPVATHADVRGSLAAIEEIRRHADMARRELRGILRLDAADGVCEGERANG